MVRNSTIENNGESGVHITNSDSNLVFGNRIVSNDDNGVEIVSGSQLNRIGCLTGGFNNATYQNQIRLNFNEGVWISGGNTSNNFINCNRIGLTANGNGGAGNGRSGVLISGGANGNFVGVNGSTRNVIGGNGRFGIEIKGAGTDNNGVYGNYIGTNVAGTAAIANALSGVGIYQGAADNWVGDVSVSGARNVISGNIRNGIFIGDAGTTGNKVNGNLIGLNAAGTAALGNGDHGVRVLNASSNEISSANSQIWQRIHSNGLAGIYLDNTNDMAIGISNTIKFNGGAGVAVVGTGTQNDIWLAQVSQNGGLPIDLDNDGHTPNDNGDGDSGPNNLLNYPVITGVGAYVYGTACPNCVVRVYEVVGDPSTPGGGGHYLTSLVADGDGNWQLDPAAYGVDWDELTTTAVQSFNTSEMSPLTTSLFNVQIQAVEVTQGVRGDIPTRNTPLGDPALPSDDAVHVANRRTIVRVYPWVSIEPDTNSGLPLIAQLSGQRGSETLPGSPLNPLNHTVTVDPGWELADMRGDENKSWNFLLPDSWLDEGEIQLTSTANPAGADQQQECAGCLSDNTAYLSSVQFQIVQTQSVQVRIYVVDHYWRDGSDNVISATAPYDEIAGAFSWWLKTWPLSEDSISVRLRSSSSSWDYVNDMPVMPPIPGIPNDLVHRQTVRDENLDIWQRTLNPYGYIPVIRSNDVPNLRCAGQAAEGPPQDFDTTPCGTTFAQEAAHTLGRLHASNAHGESGGGSVDPNYPGPHGEIEPNAYGFDIWDIRAIAPTGEWGHTHDFMSYGGRPKWVSLYTWKGIAQAFGALTINPDMNVAPSDLPDVTGLSVVIDSESENVAEYLRLSGEVHPGETAVFNTTFHVTAPVGSGDFQGQGSYRLELRDAGGQPLFVRYFEPMVGTHEGHDEREFYEIVPLFPNLAQIAILSDTVALANLPVSPNVPEISLLAPVSGDIWAATGETMLSWIGSDTDGDALTYRVEASPDGQQWFVLVGDTTETSALLNLATVPGGGEGWRVRVQASDGVNVATDEAGFITIAPKAPQPLIVQPLNGAVFSVDKDISLYGLVSDWQEQAIPDSSMTWFVDQQMMGTGSQTVISDLGLGQHEIAFRATNDVGLSGEMFISVTIVPGPWRAYLPLMQN